MRYNLERAIPTSIRHCVWWLLLAFMLPSIYAQPSNNDNDRSREQIQIIAYQSQDGENNVTLTTRDYGNEDAWQHSAIYQRHDTLDAFSGQRLIKYHGKNNQDTLATQYDALGRAIFITNTEHGLNHIKHITHQQITYTKRAGITTIAIAQLENKNSDGTPYTQYTDYNALQQKIRQWDNMPEHKGEFFNEAEARPTVSYQYNDLGQLTQITHFPTMPASFRTQEQRVYDAQGRVTRNVIRQSIPVGIQGNANQQKTTKFSDYDDAKNCVTVHEEGQFVHVDSLGTETGATTPLIGLSKTHYMNDQQQVISETKHNGISNQINYNNFAEKMGQATLRHSAINNGTATVLQTSLTHDALGAVDSAVIGNGDDKITVKFDHNDFNNSVSSKTINGIRRYRYLADSHGAILVESRGNLTPDANGQLSHARQQTYRYRDAGYTIVQQGWRGMGVNSQVKTTNQYGDVNNQRKILGQTIDDGQGHRTTITYTYNYATGQKTQSKKIASDGTVSTEDMTYRADGKPLIIVFDKNTNGNARSIKYTYFDANTPSVNNLTLDKLASKTGIGGLTRQYYYFGNSLHQINLNSNTGKTLASIINQTDALNQLVQRDRKQGSDALIDTVIYQRDALQRIKQIDYQHKPTVTGQPVIGQIRYRYDNATNNVVEKIETPLLLGVDKQITTDYQYDNTSNRLKQTSVTKSIAGNPLSPNPIVTTYTHDRLGNVIHISKTGSVNSEQDFAYYDRNGDPSSGNTLDRYRGALGDNRSDITYDNQGNVLIDDNFNHYTWNKSTNQEKTYTDKQGSVTSYGYLVYGRSKSQRYKKADGHITRTQLRSYYLAGKLVGTREIVGENAGYLSVYLGDALRLVLAPSDGGKHYQVKQLQFLQHDKTGTVENALILDANGKLMGINYRYNDDGSQENTGQKVKTKLSIFYQPLTFNGDMHDQETGLKGTDYKLARSLKHYRHGIAQFLSADYGQKLMNRRLLDNGNTVGYRDAGGHWALSNIWNSATGRVVIDNLLFFAGTAAICKLGDRVLDYMAERKAARMAERKAVREAKQVMTGNDISIAEREAKQVITGENIAQALFDKKGATGLRYNFLPVINQSFETISQAVQQCIRPFRHAETELLRSFKQFDMQQVMTLFGYAARIDEDSLPALTKENVFAAAKKAQLSASNGLWMNDSSYEQAKMLLQDSDSVDDFIAKLKVKSEEASKCWADYQASQAAVTSEEKLEE